MYTVNIYFLYIGTYVYEVPPTTLYFNWVSEKNSHNFTQ